ncbi:MAG TPA: DUF2203 domain-containing protein [Gaiellales bacterium]|nr:DUF2203 domain-containing protein [Gaiellales bacterium]
MEQERRFTLDEAQQLLDSELRVLAERMVEERAKSRDLEARWRKLVIAIGSNGGNMERPEVRDLQEAVEASHAELKEIVAKFTAEGVQVKDMDRGLIDFPAEVDGQDALLCWHVGEERIAFWHSPEDGFAGRKPLE